MLSRFNPESRLFALNAAAGEWIDVGEELADRWYPEMRSVTFCSATMSVDGDFSHFEESMGLNRLPAARHREIALPSCYDFDKNMSVIVARDLPDPRDSGYLVALENLLYDVHVAMGGSVLTLFTNRREMGQTRHGRHRGRDAGAWFFDAEAAREVRFREVAFPHGAQVVLGGIRCRG